MKEPMMPTSPQKPEEDIENMIMEDLKKPEGTPAIGSYDKAIERVVQLEKEKGIDYLTKLLNKEKFEEISLKIYNEVTAFNKREGDMENAAVISIDLNYLKTLNDSRGHLFGDKVLVSFAKKLKSLFRENDIVARIGGDEFSVILYGISEEKADQLFKEKIKNQLSHVIVEIKIDNNSTEVVNLIASAGMCMMNSSDGKQLSLDEIKEEADRRMYAAKKKFKDEHGDTIR